MRDSIRGHVWFTKSGHSYTSHYLVTWGDRPIFYDNTGAGGWQRLVSEACMRVQTLRHLAVSERGAPPAYTAVEAWPPWSLT